MRRFIMLVTVVLLMTAMLVASATPALAAAIRPPIAGVMGGGGTPVDPVVCTVVADGSPLIGWRNGTCWVFHPIAP
jgi:hypothetical protein